MSVVGVITSTTEVPPATSNPYNTANAFVVGLADWGAASGVNTPVAATSLSQVITTIGPRSATNATLYDALDAFFREGGSTVFIGRVLGPNPTNAGLVVHDSSAATALTLTAQYAGNYGNDLQVTITNTGSAYSIVLTDTYGSTIASSGSLTTVAAGAAWFNSTGYITAVTGAGTLPATLAATSLSGGSDNRSSATITNWQNALNNFSASLGPGQVLAPGQTNTTLSGIWTALSAHALANNRVAIADMDDDQPATTLVTDIGSSFNSAAIGAIGFWAGNLVMPGVVPGTTRTISPSPVIAALCARADASGNPNLAAAGTNFPLQYVTGSASLVSGNLATYNANDLNTLNSAGINTFANHFGSFENYGFVSSVLASTDAIFWQFNHQRMRMALQAGAQTLGAPFVFSQLDGQGSDVLAFNTALTALLMSYYRIGALYGATAANAFSVNTGSTVNTLNTLQAGQLNAVVSVAISPFAQLVDIVLNAVPITQPMPTTTS